MKPIPATDEALLLRTDFSDEPAWLDLYAAITAPIIVPGVGECRANVTPLSDRAYEGATILQIVDAGSSQERGFAFVADHRTIREPAHSVLVINLYEPGRSFRVLPADVWCVENNLTLANMDFEDFEGRLDEDGVFRASQ